MQEKLWWEGMKVSPIESLYEPFPALLVNSKPDNLDIDNIRRIFPNLPERERNALQAGAVTDICCESVLVPSYSFVFYRISL